MLIDAIKKIDKTHWHIARNMALVGFFVALAKVAGAAREVAIAREYGVSEIVDHYVLVTTFILLLPAVWTSVAVSVLVPVSRKLSEQQKLHFHAQLTGVICVICVALCIATVLFLPGVLSKLYPALSDEDFITLRSFVYGLSPLIGGGMLIGLLNAQLLIIERHSNTLLEGVPAISVMLFVLFWPVGGQKEPLIVGGVIGMLIHIAVLIWLLRRESSAVLPKLSLSSPAWNGFKAALGIMVLGKIVMSFIAPIEQYIAAGLGEGAIATLNYSNKLLALLLGLGATAIGRAILPVLSGPKNVIDHSRRIALQWSGLLFLFGVLLAGIGWYVSDFGVRVLFERGQFTATDTSAVAQVVRAGVYQLPFFFSSIVLVQFFASAGRYWILFVTSVSALVVKWTSSLYLSEVYGVSGIALGTTAMYVVNCLILLVAMQKRYTNHA